MPSTSAEPDELFYVRKRSERGRSIVMEEFIEEIDDSDQITKSDLIVA